MAGVNLPTLHHKLFRLLFHLHTQRRLFIDLFLRDLLAHVMESGKQVANLAPHLVQF